jgi:hypothetical protein
MICFDKITVIFCTVDEFCKSLHNPFKKKCLPFFLSTPVDKERGEKKFIHKSEKSPIVKQICIESKI